MKFYAKKRSNPTVPIISLIDILAILLIFFIATTTFKRQESLVKVNLPQSSEMAASSEKIVRVALALSSDEEISLGDQPMALADLTEGLRQFKTAHPQAKLELKADEGVPIGFLVEVWDAASRAGVKIDEIPLRILLQKGGN